MEKKLVGGVEHFYPKINVAVVKLKGSIKAGDRILIEGATTNLEQAVTSMQIHHKNAEKAKKGDAIGLKVNDRVREGDKVYIITE